MNDETIAWARKAVFIYEINKLEKEDLNNASTKWRIIEVLAYMNDELRKIKEKENV